jgi:hypothetical protein
MKKLLLLLSTIVVFASCQKKQYASFQNSNTPSYAAKKQANNAITQPTTEMAVSEELQPTVAPSEPTLVADNSTMVSSTISHETAPTIAENQAMIFDEQSINTSFEKLNKLEQYVATHEGTTLAEVKDTELTKDLTLDTNITNAVVAEELPLNIPAFWWGCVLGPVGILAVYLITDKDKDQTKKAMFGCLVAAGVWVIYYIVVVAIVGRSFWF